MKQEEKKKVAFERVSDEEAKKIRASSSNADPRCIPAMCTSGATEEEARKKACEGNGEGCPCCWIGPYGSYGGQCKSYTVSGTMDTYLRCSAPNEHLSDGKL